MTMTVKRIIKILIVIGLLVLGWYLLNWKVVIIDYF